MVNELKSALLDFMKNGSFLLINKLPLFQSLKRICFVSTSALALKVAQNNHVLTFFLTWRIKLAVKSQGGLGNKRMDIEQ